MTESESQFSDQDGESVLMGPTEGDSASERLIFKHKPFRNKRRACVINLLILLLLVMLALSIILTIVLTQKDDASSSQLTYSFDDMFDPSLKPKSYSLTWMSVGNEDYYVHWNGVPDINGSFTDVVLINPSSSDVSVLVQGSVMQDKNATAVSVSADLQYVLLTSDVHMIYRHSFNATYYLYNRSTGMVNEFDPLKSGGQIQYITWSPIGHSLAFVENYDVYILLDIDSTPTRLTFDGSDIIDGIPDWVYEEEVLATNHALWWSHDNRYLCYLSFNESNVKDFRFPHYGNYDNVYTDIYSIAYPKPGEPNPTVQVTVVKTSDATQSFKVPVPSKVTNDHLVMRATWAGSSDLLAVVWMNRVQNIGVITLCNASLTMDPCREFYEYQSAAWLDNVPLVFSPTGRYFAMLMSSPDHFTHIALFDTEEQGGNVVSTECITSGSFVVTSVLKFSADASVLYYVSTENEEGAGVSRQRHTWSVETTKHHNKRCMSCSTSCNYSSTKFSISGEWYMLACVGPDVPSYTLHNVGTKDVTVLENNTKVKEKLENIVLPQTEFFHVHSDVVPEGFEAARLLPPNFKHNKKYAVLFEVYGGPGSQKVSESFHLGWRTYLVSNFDLIVIMLDGRGTGYRGDRFMHAVYRQLGRFEADDVVDGARQLKSSLSYLDESKFAIWGWSFGGYLTSMVAGSGSEEFQSAIAVAPVTSWTYYDSVYTERYNGLPSADDNLENYEKFNVTRRAANFTTVDYLLVHGTGDDNVHFQNTAQLVEALTDAGVDYRVQFYTDKQHSLGGEVTHRHLYRLLTNFLKDKLAL